MIQTDTLLQYIDDLLAVDKFADYAPNGLQVQGSSKIKHIVTAVSASMQAIEAAIELKADALLVHHGYFWKNEAPNLTGIKGRRIGKLLAHNINLLAYHLPLDAHPTLGNNAQLATVLGLKTQYIADSGAAKGLLFFGSTARPIAAADFAAQIATAVSRPPLHIGANDKQINRVAWCTGAAQDFIDLPQVQQQDAYISGEVSERTYHSAIESGVNYFGAGHHATERYGIIALGKHLAQQFAIKHSYIELDNPV